MTIETKSRKKKILFIAAAVLVVLLFLFFFIPYYFPANRKSPETSTKENLHYVCGYADYIFKTEPDRKTISIEDLKSAGFFIPSSIEFVILDSRKESLRISARHIKSNKTFVADKDCNISELKSP